MKRSLRKRVVVAFLLLFSILLSGCGGDKKSDGSASQTATQVENLSPAPNAEGFVCLFGGEADYKILKDTADEASEQILQNFMSDLRKKVGNKNIFASSTAASESDREILIGSIAGRAQSEQAMAQTPYSAYSIGFVDEKLTVCYYTLTSLQKALDDLLAALYQAEDGTWGVSAQLHIAVDDPFTKDSIPHAEGITGRLVGAYVSNDDRCQIAYEGVTFLDFTAYGDRLVNAGYTRYASNEIGENQFATYVTDDTEVHLIWFSAISSFRIVFGERGDLPAISVPEYDKYTDCTVTQIGRYGASNSAAGESYIVQLEDGSYIVIDGGPSNAKDETRLLSFLNDNKPSAHQKPKVTWMFTHLHSDHTDLAVSFLRNHSSDIELTAICYNFPNLQTALEDSTCAATYTSIKALKQKYPNAKTIVFHAGQKLLLPGCEVEILYTQEDYWPAPFETANDTSATWRMTFAGGHSFLVLGDSEAGMCEQLERIYSDTLECDILQVSHHGLNGATLPLYQAIDPKICFWAIDETRFLSDERCLGIQKKYEFNAFLRNEAWTRAEGASGARTHYSAGRTVTVRMSDLFVVTNELLP